MPDESERLNSLDNGSAKLLLAKLSSIGDTLSGPADLYIFISFNNFITSSALVVISHNLISEGRVATQSTIKISCVNREITLKNII